MADPTSNTASAAPAAATPGEHLVTTTAVLGPKFGTTATHRDSGATLRTAAPLDNNGDGSSFSPTDLVGVALGTCMLTIMSIKAQQKGWELGEVKVTTTKRMSPPPRQIAEFVCRFELPGELSEAQQATLHQAAMSCPVKRSLAESVKVVVEYA